MFVSKAEFLSDASGFDACWPVELLCDGAAWINISRPAEESITLAPTQMN